MIYQFDPILGTGRDGTVRPAEVRTAISSDAAASRTALGLGTAATTDAAAYATAAQGAKADAAMPNTASAMATTLEGAATTAPADLARIKASVSGGGLTQVAHAAAIALTGTTYSPDYPLTAAITYTLSGTPVAGAQHRIGLIADGVSGHVPAWSGIYTDPVGDAYNNIANRLHNLFVWHDGARVWATLRDTGLTVSVPATGITLSGANSGLAGAAITYTVAANGALASSVVVTPTPVAGVTFSAASVTLTSGATSGTFTGTAASAGAYSIAVTNGGGLTNPASITLTVAAAPTAPGSPAGLTLGTPTSTTQPLTWTAPTSNGGSAITDYVVQYSPAGAGSWTTFADGTSTTAAATVTGLAAATNYDYRVAAVNSVGTGAYSSTATGATTAASSATIVRFASFGANATETGNGTTGWIYTATTNASGSDVMSGPNVSFAGDFDVRFTLANRPNALVAVLGFATVPSPTAWSNISPGIYTSGLYSPGGGVTYVDYSGGNTDTTVAAATGDIVRAVRTGSSVAWSVSKDGGSTWTAICTHTSSATLYPGLSLWNAGVSVGPIRSL